MTFALKLSRNEQCAAIVFFLVGKDLMQIGFPLQCIQCMASSVFTKPTVQVWCKKMLGGQKFASDTGVQSVAHQWLGIILCIGHSETC